jgi:uncharacterized protein YbbC (DUF1343 family)
MNSFKMIFAFFFFFLNFHHTNEIKSSAQPNFRLGNEVLVENADKIKDKRIALLTNQTGILSGGTHIIDTMVSKGLNVVKIFTPEHGIRGTKLLKHR